MFNYENKMCQALLICSIMLVAARSKEIQTVNEVNTDFSSNKSRSSEFNLEKRARQEDGEDDDDSPGLIQKITGGFNKAMSNAFNRTMTSVFGNLFSKKPEKDTENGFLDKVVQSPWFQPIFNQAVIRLAGTEIREPSKLNGTKRSTARPIKTEVEDDEDIEDESDYR